MDGWKPQPGPRSGAQTLGQAVRASGRAYQSQGDDGEKDEERRLLSIREFAELARSAQGQQAVKIAHEWKQLLPPGSKWQPGLPGMYDCAVCFGLGFVSVDLPLGHKKHGKLFSCECRAGGDYPRLGRK